MRITREQIESIRYETHEPILVAAMQRVDRHRFRGLGTARTEGFVRHGWETAQRLGLLYVNDAAYVLFLMTFLGSHFTEDFRYANIASILAEPGPDESHGFDTRVRRAREAFIPLADKIIGPKASIYRADVGRFSAWVDATGKLEIEAVLAELPRCHGELEIQLTDADKQTLRAEARASARALGLDHEEGDAIALALRWWLGARFDADPLFPWVRDITAREADAAARTRALRAYAIKRMSTVLRST